MAGEKPDTRVVLKSKATGKTVTLASYWTEGRPMPSGGLDRDVEELVVKYRDRAGNLHTETIDNRKGSVTHYANLQVWKASVDGDRDAPTRVPSAHARSPVADLPPDDTGDMDIPF